MLVISTILEVQQLKMVKGDRFKASEGPAAEIFMYKWGIPPRIYDNLSHNPKDNKVVKGIKYE